MLAVPSMDHRKPGYLIPRVFFIAALGRLPEVAEGAPLTPPIRIPMRQTLAAGCARADCDTAARAPLTTPMNARRSITESPRPRAANSDCGIVRRVLFSRFSG